MAKANSGKDASNEESQLEFSPDEIPQIASIDLEAMDLSSIDPQFASDSQATADELLIPQEVIGNDNRELAPDTGMSPFRYVCQLIGRRSDRAGGKAGTGFLVGRRTVVTAAHNLWFGDDNTHNANRVEFFHVYPGLDGPRGSAPRFGVQLATQFTPHSNYVRFRDRRFDIAVLRLNSPLDSSFGALAWSRINPLALQNRVGFVSGYPACEPRTSCPIPLRSPFYRQYFHSGGLSPSHGLLRYIADATGGQSGGPLMIHSTANQWVAVGVHVVGNEFLGNAAVPITPALGDFIMQNG